MATGSGPGQDGRLSQCNAPATVTFVFTGTGAAITAAGKGHLQAYGTGAEIDPQTTSAPKYNAIITRILVPAKTDITHFKITDVHSDEFMPSGSAPVASAAWALPVAVTPPDSLGNASGAGGLALVIGDGLSATWKGQSKPLPLGPTMILVDPGMITAVALTSRGLGARQSINLWAKQAGGRPRRRSISPGRRSLRCDSSLPRIGAEGVMLTGSLSANLDRPLTVAGNRVFIQSKLGCHRLHRIGRFHWRLHRCTRLSRLLPRRHCRCR